MNANANNEYFEKITDEDLTKFELSAVDDEWVSYFMAECSRLAYHDATRAKRHYKRIGFTTYKFFDVEGAQCHIAQNKELVIIEDESFYSERNFDIVREKLAILENY